MGSNTAHTVLIVEPDADIRSALRNSFETDGYTVIATGGAADALALLKASEIKLVVTELYLENGHEACLLHSIRRASTHEEKRILAYTRHGHAADRDWAITEGADGYVLKKNGERRLQRVSAADSSIGVTVLPNRVIARLGAVGVSFSWVAGRTDMVEDGRLLVIEWRGVLGAQRGNGTFTSGTPGRERIYRVEATDPADWRWRDERGNGLAFTTATLVEECISSARTDAAGLEPE